jgi:hypothetical protein
MFVNSVASRYWEKGGSGPILSGTSHIGSFGSEKFVNTKAAFLQNARPERQVPVNLSIPQGVVPKQGMSQYLVVGGREGLADRASCSPPLIVHHGVLARRLTSSS